MSQEALLASEATGDCFTCVQSIDSLQHDHWERTMDTVTMSIVRNSTFASVNFSGTQQLHIELIGFKWVYQV